MPYKISKKGGKHCVTLKDSGEPIKGGCHGSRDEAVSHLQALYANDAMQAIAESFREEDEEIIVDLVQDPVNEELSKIETEEDEYEEYTISPEESVWQGTIAFEGVPTGDNRVFSKDAITWDELPVPLLWQKSSTDGHGGSVVIGRVDEMEKKVSNSDEFAEGEAIEVFARGVLLSTPEALEYKALVEAGAAGGVSIDGDSAQYSVEEVEGGKHKVNFSAIRIRGLTAVAIPAFSGARINLVKEDTEFCAGGCPAEGCDHSIEEYKSKPRKRRKGTELALTAAAPIKPPINWFQDQELPGPTPLTILEDGQVFGHLALWGTCHIGMPKCTTPPKGGTYGYFHTGSLSTQEGADVSVGHLTFNTGHADIRSNAYNAASHYDHTGAVAADVVAGEDQFGIWVAGALRPHLTEEEVRAFKAAPLSGDWRRIGARMELVGALSVNTPGFPVPRERTKVLVASGEDQTFITMLSDSDFDEIGRVTFKNDLATKMANIYPLDREFSDFLDEFTVEQLESFLDEEENWTEEFYNQCHGKGGKFCEGEDGPGRLRDNMKHAESVVGKKAPQWMKNMVSRKKGEKATKAVSKIQKAQDTLPKTAPKYMHEMLERKKASAKGKR